MAKISIISASYNSDKYIEKSILAILSQKNPDVEYILIDGGSKDLTVDIIKKYREQIDYWISEKDEGIYDAWNKGVKAATGDWIMFLGTDDFLKPDAIQTYLNFLKNNDVSKSLYLSAKIEIIDEDGKFIRILGWPWRWEVFKRINDVAHPGSLHSKKLFEDYGLYDTNYKICGDYELLLRPKDKLNGFFINQITAQMTYGGASTNPKMLKECYWAVVNTGGLSKTIAVFDYVSQYFKLSLKNYTRKFGINIKLRK
jgi:glycosyltransferase involved in cell wall biosynthesis